MTDKSPSQHLPEATRKIEDPKVPERAPNPRERFVSPEMLMEDSSLSDAEKLALLEEWALDADQRLWTEAEGMSASDPMSERREGQLAEEEASVKRCISDLSKRIGQSD